MLRSAVQSQVTVVPGILYSPHTLGNSVLTVRSTAQFLSMPQNINYVHLSYADQCGTTACLLVLRYELSPV